MKEKTKSFFEKNSLTLKIMTIGLLIFMLLMPMAMIQSLVMERKNRQIDAIDEISNKWGHQQKIAGPLLSIPYYTYNLDEKKDKKNVMKNQIWFLPDDLEINAEIIPEVRYRGLFKVVVYNSIIEINGRFLAPSIEEANNYLEIDWEKAAVLVGISDLRGIKESVDFTWNGKEMVVEPGSSPGNNIKSGIVITNLTNLSSEPNDNIFKIKIHLNGSQNLSFAPVGKVTRAKIHSSWPDPGFDGTFLPVNREISKEGFSAEWKILELNRNYPQKWINRDVDLFESIFGVTLILPVETYQIMERSMKYAVLFITLTFMVFFFIEVLQKLKVHPVQYALVGFGLLLFYLLLLSLSEHIGFGPAYLIASASIVLLISGYSKGMFKSNKLTFILAGFTMLIYLVLYVLLQLHDFALLLGSIGLFIVLSVIMYFSAKIDWYSIGSRNENN